MVDDEQGDESLPEEWSAYWSDFAEAFIHPLTVNGLLNNFVTNPTVTGAFGESWVKFIVKSMLPRYRVSTGAIIRAGDRIRNNLQSIPQCDLIVWDPSELPAVFEQGDFALVPIFSARAIIEVKRTCSDISGLEHQIKEQQRYLHPRSRANILGVVISHRKPLFEGTFRPNWLNDDRWRTKPAITRLLDDEHKPDVNGIMAFIYFLAQIAGHTK